MQGTIVGGATGIVRVGTSIARAMQTGYLRAYALLLLAGVAGLVLYFLIRAPSAMTIHLSIVLFLPARGRPDRRVRARAGSRAGWCSLGTVAVLAYVVAMLIDFESGSAGLQYVTDDNWIPELGIRYSLGVDGLNLFLIVLTAVPGSPCTLVACFRECDRPQLFFFNLAPGRDRGARRVHGPGPGAVHRLLRPDAGAVLLPDRRLGQRATACAPPPSS